MSIGQFTLPKFSRYNKASLRELVQLEIFDKHKQGLTWGVRIDFPLSWIKKIPNGGRHPPR